MTTQRTLFEVASEATPIVALMRSVGPPCAFGELGIGWLGPHHCWFCAVETAKGCMAFADGVKAGRWDQDGYTPAERRAAARRRRGVT